MFEIITRAGSAAAPLAADTRAAVVRAGLYSLTSGLRDLPVVVPEMSKVQRAQVRLALCEAIGAMDAAEDQCEAVERVAQAAATGSLSVA